MDKFKFQDLNQDKNLRTKGESFLKNSLTIFLGIC
jgi:hypothetical protein